MVAVPSSKLLILYVGSHQHLATELELSVSDRGGLMIRSGRQRMMLFGTSFRFPLLLSAQADVHEWYDPQDGQFHIEAYVRNRMLGDVLDASGGSPQT